MGTSLGGGRVSVVVAAAGAAVVLSACGASKHALKPPPTSAPPSTTTTVPTTTTRPKPVHRHYALCPLTGGPAISAAAAHRAAVAVMVENLPDARPQWGLDKADIVFEVPIEGGITRFIAVFQCHPAARIEPVRSARLVDAQVLEPLGRVLFAYAGGIKAVMAEVDSVGSLLADEGIARAPGAYKYDPDRLSPHDLETSTGALHAAASVLAYQLPPPAPIFTFGPLPPGGTPASAVNIYFPLDVTTWAWDAQSRRWLRSYSDTGLAMQGDNVQVAAANVVILRAQEYATKYIEDDMGAHEYDFVLTGSGPALVLRNGEELAGTWERPELAKPAVFVEPDGTRITLAAGNTWEEVLPSSVPVTVTK